MQIADCFFIKLKFIFSFCVFLFAYSICLLLTIVTLVASWFSGVFAAFPYKDFLSVWNVLIIQHKMKYISEHSLFLMAKAVKNPRVDFKNEQILKYIELSGQSIRAIQRMDNDTIQAIHQYVPVLAILSHKKTRQGVFLIACCILFLTLFSMVMTPQTPIIFVVFLIVIMPILLFLLGLSRIAFAVMETL